MTSKLEQLQTTRTTGIPASALGEPMSPLGPPSKLAQLRKDTVLGELVGLPLLPGGKDVPVWIELTGHLDENAIEGAVFKAMADAGLPATNLHAFTYDINRTARRLAVCARDPEDPTHATPFGTLDGWLRENENILYACKLVVDDVVNRLDPLGNFSLTAAQLDELIDYWKKKDVHRLMRSGVAMLTKLLLSGAVQLAASPTPPSSSGPSAPESTPATTETGP